MEVKYYKSLVIVSEVFTNPVGVVTLGYQLLFLVFVFSFAQEVLLVREQLSLLRQDALLDLLADVLYLFLNFPVSDFLLSR